MALYLRGKNWWVDYHTNGKRIQFSAKTSDREQAEKIQELTRGRAMKTDRRDELDPGVYFLKSPALGLVKIGCSGNAGRRIEDLKNMNADDLILLAKIVTKRHRAAEGVIHDFFADKHVRREWYRISDEDVAFAVQYWERVKDAENVVARDMAMPVDRERYYSLQEIAEIMSLSVSTIRKFIREGELQKVKVGSLVRVTGSELNDYIERNTTIAVKIEGKTVFQPVSSIQGPENATA